MVKTLERVQVHVTPNFEGPRGAKKFEWMRNLHSNNWIMIHGVLDLAFSPPKKRSNMQLGVVAVKWLLQI